MMRALTVLMLVLLGDLASSCGCGCGGEASCKEGGVAVQMTGVPADQIRSFTPSGVCGPAPSPLCSPGETCDGGQAWGLLLPANDTGTCSVDLILLDGGMLNGAVHVTKTTSGCCPGTYGDATMELNGT